MSQKDPAVRHAYNQAYYEAHKEELRKKKAANYQKKKAYYHEKNVAWYAKNKAKSAERSAHYRQTHQEELREYNAAWYAAHQAERQAYAKTYRQQHQEIRLATERAYHQRKRAQRLEANKHWHATHQEHDRLYRQTHRKEAREYARQHRADNPELYAVYNSTRRARKKNAPQRDFTAAQWREMQEAYDHRCAYCGKRAKGHLTQDHLTPLSKGGAHTKSNIIPACGSCNSRKGDRAVLKPVQPLLL